MIYRSSKIKILQRLIYILQYVRFCGHFGLNHLRIILLGLFKNSGWNIQKLLAHQNPDTLIDGILLLYAIAMYTLKIHHDKLTLWIEGQNDEVFLLTSLFFNTPFFNVFGEENWPALSGEN